MKSKTQPKKPIARDWLAAGLIFLAIIIVLCVFPQKKQTVIHISWRYLLEMIIIFPAIMVIIGLFTAWIPKEMIKKYLGKASGIKGNGLSLFLGTLPTGPLYIAFPIAAALRQQGARIANIVIFFSAWACIKIPQEMVELQFLGLKFMASRLILTIILITIMALFIELIIEWIERRKNNLLA
ncbi:MAG: permease [Candidatus Aminicenantales bacterium]